MKRILLTTSLVFVLLLSAVAGTKLIDSASAQSFQTITIKADGSIDPSTASITQAGNVYTLTGSILGSITVEKFNIVIDGAGYTLQGTGSGTYDKRGIQIANPYNATIKTSYDVTVANITIQGFDEGIAVFGYWGNIINGVVIAGNNLTNNYIGIRFSSYSFYSNNIIVGNQITANNAGIEIAMGPEGGNVGGNKITGNQIANNKIGMRLFWEYSYYPTEPNPFPMNNTIYYNNFINNSQNVVGATMLFTPACTNVWDNGTKGNYWNDYNGTDNDRDGIGDTPFVMDVNNQDRYPLIAPINISGLVAELPKWLSLLSSPSPSPSIEPTPNSNSEPFSTTLITASVASAAVIGIGLLIYFKKRHHAKINKHSEIEQSSTLFYKRLLIMCFLEKVEIRS
jgi:hypothetical protein